MCSRVALLCLNFRFIDVKRVIVPVVPAAAAAAAAAGIVVVAGEDGNRAVREDHPRSTLVIK